MSIITYQNWDLPTPPALPSDWTSSGVTTTATGPTPITSPNMIVVPFGTGAPNLYVVTWNSQDGNAGQIQIQATGQFYSSFNSTAAFSILGRCNTDPFVYASSTGYEIKLTGSGFYINKIVSGTSTNLYTLAVTGMAANVWYQILGQWSGSTTTVINASVKRLSDGYDLNPGTGTFTAGAGLMTYTDSSSPISSAGYVAWSGNAPLRSGSPFTSIYGDDFTLSTYTTSLTGTGTLVCGSSLVASGSITRGGKAGLACSSVLVARGACKHAGTVSLICSSLLTGVGHRIRSGQAGLTITSVLVVHGTELDEGVALIVANSLELATGQNLHGATAGLTLTSVILGNGTPPRTYQSSATLVGGATTSTTAIATYAGSASLVSSAVLTQVMPTFPTSSQFSMFAPGCPCQCQQGCACQVTICVQGCGGLVLAGATVTITGGGSQVTGIGGCTSFCISKNQSLPITVSSPGYYPSKTTLSPACGSTKTIKLTLLASQPPIQFQVNGCCLFPLPGADVNIGGFDYTTDVNGQADVGISDPGTYPWTVSKGRFITQTGTVTIGPCPTSVTVITVDLLPALGFLCQNKFSTTNSYTTTANFPDPIPPTLVLTDSVWGTVDLVWNAGGGYYSGVILATVNNCDCPQTVYPITYVWQGPCSSSGGYLAISVTYFFPNRLNTPCLVNLSCNWLGGADPCHRGEALHSNGFVVATGSGIAGLSFEINSNLPFFYEGSMPAQTNCESTFWSPIYIGAAPTWTITE